MWYLCARKARTIPLAVVTDIKFCSMIMYTSFVENDSSMHTVLLRGLEKGQCYAYQYICGMLSVLMHIVPHSQP